jgi:UDP-N-acetylmuramoylalanine-D-glutamate ligase
MISALFPSMLREFLPFPRHLVFLQKMPRYSNFRMRSRKESRRTPPKLKSFFVHALASANERGFPHSKDARNIVAASACALTASVPPERLDEILSKFTRKASGIFS